MDINEKRALLIKKINELQDERKLSQIEHILNSEVPKFSAEEVFKRISARYNDTLRRLAE